MTWNAKRMEAAAKVKALREAGFSSRDIIEAKKCSAIEALLGKE